MEGNRHYIRLDEAGNIVEGWSDGPQPGKDTAEATLLREDGGYQFRLFEGGEENPVLWDEYGVPLYRWDGEVIERTAEELEADRPAPAQPAPTMEERNRADIDYLMVMGGYTDVV